MILLIKRGVRAMPRATPRGRELQRPRATARAKSSSVPCRGRDVLSEQSRLTRRQELPPQGIQEKKRDSERIRAHIKTTGHYFSNTLILNLIHFEWVTMCMWT